MPEPARLDHALRCLQQLAASSAGLLPDQIARAEGLDVEVLRAALGRLCEAGLIERVLDGGERYRLAREPASIRVSEVAAALGGGRRAPGGVTLADLIGWEARVFESPGIPLVA